jgi:hypothetical protein
LINNGLYRLSEIGRGWQEGIKVFVGGIGESFPQFFPQKKHRQSGFFHPGQLASLLTFKASLKRNQSCCTRLNVVEI